MLLYTPVALNQDQDHSYCYQMFSSEVSTVITSMKHSSEETSQCMLALTYLEAISKTGVILQYNHNVMDVVMYLWFIW